MTKIEQNKSLKSYNTFGIDVSTRYFATYQSVEELQELLQNEALRTQPYLHIGGGSNLLFIEDFDGIILHSIIKFIRITAENPIEIIVEVGAGVSWDDWVAYAVEKAWYGIENLSAIPGEVGASAIQNIGAYGVEVQEVIEKVHTVEKASGKMRVFDRLECQYGYRKSIFKGELRNQYIVTSVEFKLSKRPIFNLTYGHLKRQLGEEATLTLSKVRETIITIRAEKLPDTTKIGNAGSFFMNPIVERKILTSLLETYPNIPFYEMSDKKVKIPAGWLIEQCGFKGFKDKNVGVYSYQALVLVNYGDATGREVVALADRIQQKVLHKFEIKIVPEVLYISS